MPDVETKLIPINTEGKPVDIEAEVNRKSIEEAVQTYNAAKAALLQPMSWENLPGFTGASFMLEKKDKSKNGDLIEINDWIRIDIPGPGPSNGGGFDWVVVEAIEENFDITADRSFAIKVRPCSEPANDQPTVAAHFFKESAISTFIVKQYKNKVTACYHGRNEVPNLKGAGFIDAVRNAFVSFGALAGLSKIQWKLLVQGLLKTRVEH